MSGAPPEPRHLGTYVLQTAVAVVLTLVTYTIVSVVVHTLTYVLETLATVLREGLILFSAGLVSAIAGVAAAYAACDAVLKDHARIAVPITLTIYVLLMLAASLATVGPSWDRVGLYSSAVAAVFASWAYRVA